MESLDIQSEILRRNINSEGWYDNQILFHTFVKCAQRRGKLEEIFKEKIQKCGMRIEKLKKNTPIVTEKTQKLRWMKMKNEAHSGSK